MRHEVDRPAVTGNAHGLSRLDPLFDFSRMTVIEYSVRSDAAVALREVGALRWRFARARYTGLGVNDDVRFRGKQASGDQRCQCQKSDRRVAARIRHEASYENSLPFPLCQAVRDTVREVIGLRIPARTIGRATKTERAREVDDTETGLNELGRHLCGGSVWQRQKDDVGLALDGVERLRRKR